MFRPRSDVGFKEALEAARRLRRMCAASDCSQCPFCEGEDPLGCLLRNVPAVWELEEAREKVN